MIATLDEVLAQVAPNESGTPSHQYPVLLHPGLGFHRRTLVV